MTSSSPADQPLAAFAGVPVAPVDSRNPFAALDDLMTVVEALCPIWPPRAPAKTPGCYRL